MRTGRRSVERVASRRVCWVMAGAWPALLLGGGCGSSATGPREVRAECRLVRGSKTIEAITCRASFNTGGLSGEQVVIDVGLVNRDGRPLRSATGKFANERGHVSARRTVIIGETSAATSEVKVTIPMREFTLRPEDYPLWADVCMSLPSGETLSRTRVAALWTPTGELPAALAEAAQREMERMSGSGSGAGEPRVMARRSDSGTQGAGDGDSRPRSERRRDDREPEIAARSGPERAQRTERTASRGEETGRSVSSDERLGDGASREESDVSGEGRSRATKSTREPASTGSGTQSAAPKGKGEPIRPTGRREERGRAGKDGGTAIPELKPAPTPTSMPADKKVPAQGEAKRAGEDEVERSAVVKMPRTAEAAAGGEVKGVERREGKSAGVGRESPTPSGGSTREGERAKLGVRNETEVESASDDKKQPTTFPKTAGSARKSYRVKPGDTLQSIARQELGDETRWVEIQILNPGVKPLRPGVGRIIELPAGEAGTKRSELLAKPTSQPAVPASGRTYVVRKGDTLPIIALRVLGNANRWREIYDLNREKLGDVNEMREGTELRVPKE